MGWLNLLNSLEPRLGVQEQLKKEDMMDTMVGKGHVNNEGTGNRRTSVSLDSDMAGPLAACGGRRQGGQRWTHRQHGACQAGPGEDRTVCPYSQQVRDLELPRLFQRPHD